MSLLPLIFRDMMSMSRPLRMLENHIRLTDQLMQPFITPMFKIQKWPKIEFQEEQENIIHDKEKFQVKLDMQSYAPEDIVVKTIDGNIIQIEAKHEREEETGFLSRQLIRKFVLPDGHDLKNVVSNLSSDGILTITSPKTVDSNQEETIVKINYTGPEREANKKTEK